MEEYIQLLQKMIQTPSFSREESYVASIIRDFLKSKNINFQTQDNNTWCKNNRWEEGKPVILLDSHIDTVKPAKGWNTDPYTPILTGDKLTGLGSNDAGAPLVTLMAVFIALNKEKELPYNLIFAASAEEEISGPNGMVSILPKLGKIDFAVIGEPSGMEMAIAEKGLLVIDGSAHGKAGHAARNNGINAIYKALEDINILKDFKFEKASDILGPVKISVTQIKGGYQHNTIPDLCTFVIDVRTNEFYSNREAFKILKGLISSDLKQRSFRLNSSRIPMDHPIVLRAKEIGINCYGSPTTSDQAIIPCPSVKIGPGDSNRSHTADEYILLSEIENSFPVYIKLLKNLHLN